MLEDDTYEGLGPQMRARLDRAELDLAKVRDWISLAARTHPQTNLAAAYLCLALGWAPPRPWED